FGFTCQLSWMYPEMTLSAKLRTLGVPGGETPPVLGIPRAVSLNCVIDPVNIMKALVTAVEFEGCGNGDPVMAFVTSLQRLIQKPLVTEYEGNTPDCVFRLLVTICSEPPNWNVWFPRIIVMSSWMSCTGTMRAACREPKF